MEIEITSGGIRIDIEPEKWIKEDLGGVEYTAICPKCGYATFWSDIKNFNYCPACEVNLKHGKYFEGGYRVKCISDGKNVG